ncbi:class I glutamine amidotransferase-like protein [Exophiala viscosa]|uniref:Class I glutamine amidotransferase-like protein n=1 Tax=Exophiala viscosa TaxID=2486360 RepID=A0AAN6IFQ7_9EURO|nr:class I glutamine amidotransferase-like protein [Exophiala viscosa]
MIAKAPRPPRVAIIRNYLLDGSWGQDMLDSFSRLILAAEPDANIQYFQPLEGGDLPDASRFDLVILTGGTYDLTLPDTDPWVAKLLGWIRDTVSHNPETKLLGICWGHQAISHALGGKIAYRKDGTLIDVVDVRLTNAGRNFFDGYELLRMHKFHKRIVLEPGLGLQPLAEDNEIFASPSGQILTFQGHPEMTAKIAQGILDHRDLSYLNLADSSPEGVAQLHKGLEKVEDGKQAFARVMSWAFGPQA